MAQDIPDEPVDEATEYTEKTLNESPISQEIKQAVGEAVSVKSHVASDEDDVCGYCGQHFGPDDIVVEREVYGRKWSFCDEQCLNDFLDKSDFKDENLDADPEDVSPHPDDLEEQGIRKF